MKLLCSLFVVCPFLFGCVSPGPVAEESLQWRVQRLESAFFEFKDQKRRERKWQEEQLEDLQARLDHVSYMLRREVGERTYLNATEEREKTKVKSSTTKKPSIRTESNASEEQADKEMGKEDKADDSASGGAAKEAGPRERYQQALQKLRSGHPEAARQALKSFIKDHASHELAPNAYYWLAETYYSQKKYAQSILAFKEVTERFPEHHKAADALLKIGYAYVNLGDLENADFYLSLLIEDYPQSKAVDLARKKLEKIQ